MEYVYSSSFYDGYLKKRVKTEIPKELIEKTINIFKENERYPSLQLKRINCKNNKNLYSIRINQKYRILLTKKEEIIIFERVCHHDLYDQYIKNC